MMRLLYAAGKKFKLVGWSCIVLLIVTGFFTALARYGVPGQTWSELGYEIIYRRPLMQKICALCLVMVLSYIHDFQIMPAAVRAMRNATDAPEVMSLRKAAAWIARANLGLVLVILWLALKLARETS